MALLNFMDAITTDVLESTSGEDEKDTISNQAIASDNGEPQPSVDQKESVVKGLLGSGKERTLFSLMLNIRHAVFILNSDDGRKIASLAQEHMSCNIQVHLYFFLTGHFAFLKIQYNFFSFLIGWFGLL